MINQILLTLGISFVIQILFFIFAALFKTDKVTDMAYGLTFVILSWFLMFYTQSFGIIEYIVAAMVSLWGIRLASYLFIRILKIGKDKRFDGIREDFWKFASFWVLQAISISAIMLPVTFILTQETPRFFGILAVLGIIMWVKGFIFQSIGDAQKFAFKNRYPDKFISTGLWKYSRHPNYYGEILMWWGIFLIAAQYLHNWEWLVIIGPIWITSLLLFVTGIPTTEKRAEEKYKGYKKYKEKTSMLIPWFPKD